MPTILNDEQECRGLLFREDYGLLTRLAKDDAYQDDIAERVRDEERHYPLREHQEHPFSVTHTPREVRS